MSTNMQISVPYPSHPYDYYWGPPTASSNFCEEDYVITTYVAEFINTLTNLTYIIYCLHGLHNLHLRHRLTWSAALPHLGLLGVGVCSAAFHITLREYPQLADDLSMVLPTAAILLRLLTFQAPHPGQVTALFFAALGGVYTIHLNINKPILHTLTFGVMVHMIRVRVFSLLSTRIASPPLRRRLNSTALFGALSFAFGFGLWVIDRFACSQLTSAKRWLGMPWSFALELHGWWHVFTGIGAYVFIVLAEYLTGEMAGMDPGDAFGWPARWVVGVGDGRGDTLMNGVDGVNGVNGVNGVVGKGGKGQ